MGSCTSKDVKQHRAITDKLEEMHRTVLKNMECEFVAVANIDTEEVLGYVVWWCCFVGVF